MVDMMAAGQINGLFCQGLNIMMAAPQKEKTLAGLSKLKWLVVIDPIETETARFWENHGEFNNVNPKSIQTEVFQLPTSVYVEEEGSFTNSSRVIQWHWKAADGPGDIVDELGQAKIVREGKDLTTAYYETLNFTGRVVALIGVTLAAGVVTWALSPIKFQADMGILLTFMFIWNMFGALILMPALAVFLLKSGDAAKTA